MSAATMETTETESTATPRKRKGYPLEGVEAMLTAVFRNGDMPKDVRAAAQARALAANRDQGLLWELLQDLRREAHTWTPARAEGSGQSPVRPPVPAPLPIPAPPAASAGELSLFDVAPSPAPARPAPVPAPKAPVAATVTPSPARPAAVPAPRAQIHTAAHGDLAAIAQLRRCSVCGKGLVAAPPAPRVCSSCGEVALLPAFNAVPDRFLEWLGHLRLRSTFHPWLSKQGVFERWLQGAYQGTWWGTGHDKQLISRAASGGDIYPFALQDYSAWQQAGCPTDLWGTDHR